jgi:hypoxanthine phosphoribosyltransferase
VEVTYVSELSYRLTWEEVDRICRDIAQEADRSLGPNLIVGIGKGGLIPASIIASLMRVDLHPCLVTRRRHGEVVSDRPEIVVSVTDKVAGQRVLIVDEMVLTGETMRIVSAQCKKEKAKVVRTACIWASSESWKPTWYSLETSGRIMFPWDYEVLLKGKFVLNPDYQEYLDSLEMSGGWAK